MENMTDKQRVIWLIVAPIIVAVAGTIFNLSLTKEKSPASIAHASKDTLIVQPGTTVQNYYTYPNDRTENRTTNNVSPQDNRDSNSNLRLDSKEKVQQTTNTQEPYQNPSEDCVNNWGTLDIKNNTKHQLRVMIGYNARGYSQSVTITLGPNEEKSAGPLPAGWASYQANVIDLKYEELKDILDPEPVGDLGKLLVEKCKNAKHSIENLTID